MDCSGFVSKALAPAAFLALFVAAAPASAADVTGLWATPVHGGQVEIVKCGASVCGRIVTSDGIKTDPGLKDVKNSDASKRDRALKGQQVLGGFSGGPTEWTGGQIYNAEDGKTYSATLTLDGDNTLKVRGCIVVPLCQTQTWNRVR